MAVGERSVSFGGAENLEGVETGNRELASGLEVNCFPLASGGGD